MPIPSRWLQIGGAATLFVIAICGLGVRDIPPGSIGTRAPRPIKKSENQDIGRGLRNIGIIRGESAT